MGCAGGTYPGLLKFDFLKSQIKFIYLNRMTLLTFNCFIRVQTFIDLRRVVSKL
jgi:hypothetical protein